MTATYAKSKSTIYHLPLSNLKKLLTSGNPESKEDNYLVVILTVSLLEITINETISLSNINCDPFDRKEFSPDIRSLLPLKEYKSTFQQHIEKFLTTRSTKDKLKIIFQNFLDYEIHKEYIFQKVSFLIDLRNELIHHKMIYIDEKFAEHELIIRKYFDFYKDKNKPLSSGAMSSYLTDEGRNFALNTFKELIDLFQDKALVIDLESLESKFKKEFISEIKKQISYLKDLEI